MNAAAISRLKHFAHSGPPDLVSYVYRSSVVFVEAGERLPLESPELTDQDRLIALQTMLYPSLCLPFDRTCLAVNHPAHDGALLFILPRGERMLSSGRRAVDFTCIEFDPETSLTEALKITVRVPAEHVIGQPLTWEIVATDLRCRSTGQQWASTTGMPDYDRHDLERRWTTQLNDFFIVIAGFFLPCFYRVRVTPEGKSNGKERVLRGFSIYRCLTHNRLHLEYQGAKHHTNTVTPHPRRAFKRYHWARAGIDRKKLPSELGARMRLAWDRHVTYSFVKATWVGDQTFLVGDLRYEVGPSLFPNASPTFDNRLVSVDQEFAAVASDYETAQEADLDRRCAEAMSYGGARVLS